MLIRYLQAIRIHTLFFPLMTASFWAYLTPFSCQTHLFLLMTLHFLLIQMGVNLWNTYEDYQLGVDGKDRKHVQHVIQKYHVSPQTILLWFVLTYTFALVTALFILPSFQLLTALFLTSLALLTGMLYTGINGLSLSHLGLGELLAFLVFGPSVVLYYDVYLEVSRSLSSVFWIGSIMGLWSMALMLANNIRDVEVDKKAHKITLPILIGKEKSYLLLYTCFISLFLWGVFSNYFYSTSLIPLLILISLSTFLRKKPTQKLLPYIGKMAWGQSFIYLILNFI